MGAITRERLFRTGDASKEAIAVRLNAALEAVGLQQKQLAQELDLRPSTLNHQVKNGTPKPRVIAYLYRHYGIDFNFVLHGDFARLPADLQARLEAALRA